MKYLVEFKAFATGEWYKKTSTNSKPATFSVAKVQSQGRSYQVRDTETDTIILKKKGEKTIYEQYGTRP